MAGIDTSQIKFPDEMDLRTASIFLGISEMRVRTLARQKALPASKDENGKWVFKKSDLQTFKDTPRARGGGGPRGEGKAWIINVKHADLEKVKAALAQFSIALQPRYNYAAQKAYRAKRAAQGKGPKKAAQGASGQGAATKQPGR